MKFSCLSLIALALAYSASNLPGGAVFYVDLNSAASRYPFYDWNTAATNIQDTIDAASNGDLVLVNNGIYRDGAGSHFHGIEPVGRRTEGDW